MHKGLLQAVIESPRDDTPRLVLADWLDEHGEPTWAEFVRVQCGASDGDAVRLFELLDPQLFGLRSRVEKALSVFQMLDDRGVRLELRRGFVHTVLAFDVSIWRDRGPEIVASQPIERVVIHNKVPSHWHSELPPSHWRWFCEGLNPCGVTDEVPVEVFEHIPRVGDDTIEVRLRDTRELALEALSEGLISWARAR